MATDPLRIERTTFESGGAANIFVTKGCLTFFLGINQFNCTLFCGMQQPKGEEIASATPPLPPREENAEPGSYDCWEDKKYFDEYAKLDIHCDMLHDRYCSALTLLVQHKRSFNRLRMNSYYRAISENVHVVFSDPFLALTFLRRILRIRLCLM